MKVNQISTILSEAMTQVFGMEDISTLNLKDLIAMGNKAIADADADVFDNLYNALLDRVYQLVLSTRKFMPEDNNIIHDYATYGAILEKVYYEPLTAEENPSWQLASNNGKSIDPFKITLNQVKVKLFADRTTWEVAYTVQPDVALRTAFLGESEMGAFLEGIYQNAENSLNAQLEAVEKWTISNFIACKLYAQANAIDGIHAINLLTEYKKIYADSTVDENSWKYDADFLRFCAMTLKAYYDKLCSGRYTTTFNTEGFKRFTNPEDGRLKVLSDFNTAMETYLQSSTYHRSLVELPTFDKVSYWQGSGTNFDTDSCSTISITTSDGHVVEVSGVVAFIHDYDALGVTIWNRRTTSQYNGKGEYQNYWNKADVGLFNDLSENALVFYIADADFEASATDDEI